MILPTETAEESERHRGCISKTMTLLEQTRSTRCHELREGVACGGFYDENDTCTRCGITKHEPYNDPQSVEYWRGVRTKDDVRREVTREVELLRQTVMLTGDNAQTQYLMSVAFPDALIDMLVDARWEHEKDLSDLDYITDQVTEVYDHITGGQLTKPNYEAGVVIAAAEDNNTQWTDEIVEEATEELRIELNSLEEKHSRLHKLASDLCYLDEHGHGHNYTRTVNRLHNFLFENPDPLPLWRRAGRKLKAIFAVLRRKVAAISA